MFHEEREEKLCASDVWEVGVGVGGPNMWSDYFVVVFWDFRESCVGITNEGKDIDLRGAV